VLGQPEAVGDFLSLEMLADRLSRRALIVEGDLAREGEREIVADC
jgi:hypothetical protein